MLKRIITYSFLGVFVIFAVLVLTGLAVRKWNAGKIAPGVTVWGQDVSGFTVEEAETIVKELLPEFAVELRCRFLPEQKDVVEIAVRDWEELRLLREWRSEAEAEKRNGAELGDGEEMGGSGWRLSMEGQEVCLSGAMTPVRLSVEGTLENVLAKSGEVKVWEWLYGGVTGKAFREREAEAEVTFDTELFHEMVEMLGKITEKEAKDATVCWENGRVKVTESERGFRLCREKIWKDEEQVTAEVLARLQKSPAERMVLRFDLKGDVLEPGLSHTQAEKCNTVIGEFSTGYAGAGAGRAQNISAGAARLHGKVILPWEVFSVAEALQPFTEANGYAAGGTYIDGQLSESMGGGVCQLSTTLYNALLQTNLTITERHPHSMPVGYVPLGQDAAIAGDYKDLKFQNTSGVPVLLLCEATGDAVKVTLYGGEESGRGPVTVESRVTEETKESVTVEVYREERGADSGIKRERVSRDKYRKQEKK